MQHFPGAYTPLLKKCWNSALITLKQDRIFNFQPNLCRCFRTTDVTVAVWPWRQHKGREKRRALASGHILKEKRDAKWNADWKEEKINQARLSDWQLAKVFSVEVSKNSTIALPRPPLLFLFPPLSLSLSHPSLASSPIITLSSPPKRLTKLPQYLSHFSLHCSSSSTIPRTPSHLLSLSLLHFTHRDAFIASH